MDRELLHRRRRIERARARFDDERDGDPDRDRSGEGAALPPITGSWERCAGALGEDAASVPVDVDVDEAEARWDASPIRRGASELLIELADLARSHDYISAVTDAGGRIIWSAAGRTMVRRAEAARFVTGGAWDERAAGTNAPGLALVTGRPETVFAGAHWRAVVHDWVCYAAPIRAPSGEIVGVLDLSATWDRASPLALTTVTSMARLVEQQLRAQVVDDAEPPGDGVDRVDAPAAQLAALGHGHLVIAGHEAKPPLRHLEILVILLAEKELSLDQLHTHLYGDNPVGATTLKSEISRLRHTLGGGIASRPYRLTVPVRADFTDVLDALRRRDLATATRRYTGQLLPASEAPYVTDLRHHIDVALRNTLLRHGTAAQLLSFADVHPFDLEVLEQATRVATPDDPTTADLAARLTRPTPTRLSNHASAGRQRG